MNPEPSVPPPLRPSLPDLSKLLDYSLIRPELSVENVLRGCDLARRLGLASVIVRPSDLEAAARVLNGSPVALGTAVAFAEDSATSAVKQFAVRDALRRGAREIETALNLGKLISREFRYLEIELRQLAEACHETRGVLKVRFFGSAMDQEGKIVACRILRRAGADFAIVDTVADLALVRDYAREQFQLKLSAPIETAEDAAEAHLQGAARIESRDPEALIAAWRAFAPAD